jgi:hypothetical protein
VAPAAVLLDLGLPDVDGKEVLREARGFSKAPVIVFVRARSLSEKNLSLDASADVYLERPFRVGELMARQRVALRRSSKAGGITPSLRRIVVELDKRLVTRNVKPVKLTPENTETKGKTAIRRIDATYRRYAGVAMDPWLWDEWAEAVIQAVHAHCLERKDPVETETAIETKLDEVRGAIEAALPSHPVTHAVAVRIYRYQWYQWHFKECLEHSLLLLKEPLIGRDRIRALRLCERAIRQLILEPPALRYWTAPEDQLPKLSGLYRNTLIETLSTMGRSSERLWAQAAIQVLDGKLDETIADQLVKRVGQLERYWESLASARDAGEPDPELSGLLALVEDMTDSTAVGLISTLLRRSTLDTNIPILLREKLARGALISAIQTEMWERSIRGTPTVTTLLRVAFAVGIGLSLSHDDTLLESKTAPILSSRKGRPMLWQDFMRSRFNTARSRGRAISQFCANRRPASGSLIGDR